MNDIDFISPVYRFIQDTKFFSKSELECSCCGTMYMDLSFVVKLVELRVAFGLPMPVTSGYRCKMHKEEKGKEKIGMHTLGRAIDIAVPSVWYRAKLIRLAHEFGFRGVGFSNNFVHLDNREIDAMWTYGE